jgi:pantothenate kinase-related protein Tda10
MESLDTYDAIMVKERIATPVADTLAWLVQDSKFTQWLTSENAQFLWIHGEPGCGKSVMSAYVVDHLQRFQTESVVCHFFCSRLSETQNNTRVLLQGILHQLFIHRPDLIEHALERKKTVKDFANKLRLLWDMLLQSIQDPRSGQVILVVDGFDECDSKQV